MGFWSLFEVASMPILQVLLISVLGALMATDYCNLLSVSSRKSLNKIVFVVFTPSLMFACLAETVTLQDIISWWFMPINIGLTFLIGGILGWIVVKILRPKPHVEGLVIASCSSGNLGNLLLIIIPAICDEDASPFGRPSTCRAIGLSYASFSMALGGFFIWTYTYQLVRSSAMKFKALEIAEELSKEPNKDLEASDESHLLKDSDQGHAAVVVSSANASDVTESHASASHEGGHEHGNGQAYWSKFLGFLHQLLEELLAPPTLGAILGLVFGAVSFLKELIIGDNAPLRVIQDSVKLLGDGTIPCITLILGGNLTQGLRSSKINPIVIIGVICVRFVILPAIGIWVVEAASSLGFLPADRLFQFVLMVQYALPPAMNIGTMTQLFDVGQEECSVLFLWTYLAAALALTLWSTIYMWILS
ncbi:hypothetical protein K2173_004959 [Erythroxylum novogranatense]|uniref:Auxin efflux carrier family protein n=1 Tax=Erythroxylum novogranatense TaxID=1862640 RepID=A0AAV8TBD3_9ROSI|nr:hypothetical protein K2173_004959 [Erythroxylum novogranatense]